MFSGWLTYVVAGRVFRRARLDRPRDEAEDRTEPQQQREAAKQLFTELYPLRDRLGWAKLIGAVTFKHLTSALHRQTLTHVQHNISRPIKRQNFSKKCISSVSLSYSTLTLIQPVSTLSVPHADVIAACPRQLQLLLRFLSWVPTLNRSFVIVFSMFAVVSLVPCKILPLVIRELVCILLSCYVANQRSLLNWITCIKLLRVITDALENGNRDSIVKRTLYNALKYMKNVLLK